MALMIHHLRIQLMEQGEVQCKSTISGSVSRSGMFLIVSTGPGVCFVPDANSECDPESECVATSCEIKAVVKFKALVSWNQDGGRFDFTPL
jgi:hypothetical protein